MRKVRLDLFNNGDLEYLNILISNPRIVIERRALSYAFKPARDDYDDDEEYLILNLVVSDYDEPVDLGNYYLVAELVMSSDSDNSQSTSRRIESVNSMSKDVRFETVTYGGGRRFTLLEYVNLHHDINPVAGLNGYEIDGENSGDMVYDEELGQYYIKE